MFVAGVVVEDNADHGAIEHAKRDEQGGRAVRL
jgi:hypothetical protein